MTAHPYPPIPHLETEEEALKRVKWPVGGFAPGGYHGRCNDCGTIMSADKRATQCLPCGIESLRRGVVERHELEKIRISLKDLGRRIEKL